MCYRINHMIYLTERYCKHHKRIKRKPHTPLKKLPRLNMVNLRNCFANLSLGIMPRTYRRDLIVLFVGKLILLIGLFLACFSPKNRPQIGSKEATNLILSKEETHNARS